MRWNGSGIGRYPPTRGRWPTRSSRDPATATKPAARAQIVIQRGRWPSGAPSVRRRFGPCRRLQRRTTASTRGRAARINREDRRGGEAQHDPVRHPTGRADRGPGAVEVAGRRQVPAPGVDHLLRPAAPADEREVHDLQNAQHRELDDDPGPPGRPVVLEDGAQHVTPLQGAGLRQRPVACRRGLEVGHRRGRRDDDPGAGDAGPPRQVDVLAEHRDLVVEAPDRGEQVGAHEDAAARDGEDLAGLVVLGLVELPALDPAHRRAEAVHVQAELQDAVRLGLVDELRADDPGVRAHRLFDHHPNGVVIEDDVVVAEQVVGRARARRRVPRSALGPKPAFFSSRTT